MNSDDFDDIKAGVESLKRATQSIQTAQRAVNSMRESNDKRDAEIALTHAEELTALARAYIHFGAVDPVR